MLPDPPSLSLGEVTPEEANRIGYETAMRWRKGKYQFFVGTHTDKGHIHNHIYYNSTAYDRSRKIRNFIGSSFALQRLSDQACLEHAGPLSALWAVAGRGSAPVPKEQIRRAIDETLAERLADFADFLRRMAAAGIHPGGWLWAGGYLGRD